MLIELEDVLDFFYYRLKFWSKVAKADVEKSYKTRKNDDFFSAGYSTGEREAYRKLLSEFNPERVHAIKYFIDK